MDHLLLVQWTFHTAEADLVVHTGVGGYCTTLRYANGDLTSNSAQMCKILIGLHSSACALVLTSQRQINNKFKNPPSLSETELMLIITKYFFVYSFKINDIMFKKFCHFTKLAFIMLLNISSLFQLYFIGNTC